MKQNSDNARRTADAAFKKERQAIAAAPPRQQFEADGVAMREKTARLKALRLARAQASNEESPKDSDNNSPSNR